MVHQASGKIDLADSLLGNNQKLNQRLDKINCLIDWKPFEQTLAIKLIMLPHVISGDENWVFADKAYNSEKNHVILQEKNLQNGILMKGTCTRNSVTLKRCAIEFSPS